MKKEFHTRPLPILYILMLAAFGITFITSFTVSDPATIFIRIISGLLVIYCFVQLTIRYTLIVEAHRLLWNYSFFGRNLYTREANANNMKEIVFKRFGFYKGVQIQFQDGFRWKLIQSKSEGFDKQLVYFAKKKHDPCY